jgi:hypothetical protein
MPNGTTHPPGYRAPTDYAIVVGIDDYNAGIPALQGCVNDALLFQEWLLDPDGGGLDPANIHFIQSSKPPNGRPPRDEIENLILTYYDHQNTTGRSRGRRLYLYFAGHGVTPNPPLDDDCGIVMANAVSQVLRSLPGRLTTKRVQRASLFEETVLFMDCCRQVRGRVTADCDLPDGLGDPTLATKLRFIYGFAAQWAMTASEQMLPHPVDPKKQHMWQGVFTHTLIRGLRSAIDPATNDVNSASLKQFVINAVQQLLPPDDNRRPLIQWSEDLPPISFGKGVRVPVEVFCAAPPPASVQVLDGSTLVRIASSNAPSANGAYRFELVPARYVVQKLDAAGNVIGAEQLIQVFGAPVRVDL